ncbi:hypothetical protein CDV31_006621 [Fusarium ambrosium]|uniref:Major facilitator superfamily (MFS) profile domain-containing protein n=1 Tax=Fusarium ambrosium TaxID=131363 RepID=A0A428UBT4_9HYPO|nr:hypothetical protein CDV31_006621 [Fusarium ambrosium]
MARSGFPSTDGEDAGSIRSQSTLTRTDVQGAANYSSNAEAEKVSDELDTNPNIVDWDGPDDPHNPLNWTSKKKVIQVVIVSLFTLNANLAATMYAPGAHELAAEFNITNSTVAALTVSLYVLGFAIGPLFLAPLSELYGRLIIYYVCHVLFIGFTFGCAFSTNTGMFLAFRLLGGCAASGPMSVGGGSIADLYPAHERGKAMALFSMGPLIGPVIGPIIGGFVSQHIGWRWTFRLILIVAGVILVATVVFVGETNAAVLIRHKTERLRKETGNEKLVPKYDRAETPKQMLLRAIVRPIKMLIFSPIVLLMSLYTGIIFGMIFLLFTTFTSVFSGTYGFSVGVSGLVYLGLGIGMMLGLVTFSKTSDKLMKIKADQGGSKPEDRLILMKWLGITTPAGFFWYGWSAYYHTHWIVPILGTFFIGVGALFVIVPGQLYLVDCFGAEAAASALAANLLIRCPFGAFLDLAAPSLYDKLDLCWGNSVLGFIVLAFTPVPFLFHAYGETLRKKFPVDL